MATNTAFAEIAALAGDPARAGMLHALLDGRALTATELARAAGVTPQTASGHLSRLIGAGLLAVSRQGRHRYHRLASRRRSRA
jgi:DNA-binding transcriptional ArsR family regulator